MAARCKRSAWLLAAASSACLLGAVSSSSLTAADHRAGAGPGPSSVSNNAAVPGLSRANKARQDRHRLLRSLQQVGTTAYSNVNVATGDASGADSAAGSVTVTAAPQDWKADETAVIDSQFDEDEEILVTLAEELPADEVSELDEGNVDGEVAVDEQQQQQPQPPEEPELVSCMDWIPTDPTTPPSAYQHCYDGTYAYTLTATSRPARCSPQHFNHGQYNYQQILGANTAGASPSDEWTICAHWFNLHAGLPTAYEDLSLPNLYPLSKIGNGGTYDLPACTGDCDSDAECQPGLFCLIRNLNSSPDVVFCGGVADGKVDYCIPERYRDPDFDTSDYLEELEEAIKESVAVESAPPPPPTTIDSTGDQAAGVVEEPDVQGDAATQSPGDGDSVTADEAVEDLVAEEPAPPTMTVDEPQEETFQIGTNDPGPAIEDTQGPPQDDIGTSEELAYDDPEDRPKKTFPIEVALPSFFMAIDVRIRNANKRRLQDANGEEDTTRTAEPVIDVDALRVALQNVLQASISTLDDRLWGVTVQATNVDTVAMTLSNGRAANREFFSVHAQAIFLVLETGDGTEITALDANPLPDEEQLRAAMELALQKNTLLEEFSEAKGRTKLPRATNVGASFMDGSPISGSYEEAEAEAEAEADAVADGETIVSIISSSSSEEEGSFFSTLTISAIAGAFGAMIFVIGGAAIYSRRRAVRKNINEDLSPRSRSFPQQKSGKQEFDGDDSDPDPMEQTFSGDTHPISPSSSTKEEEKKQKMEQYFEKLENVESQPEPSIDGESDFDFDTSQYSESECGMTMSEWSVNDIGKGHVQLTDRQALKPEKSIASMGKRMRHALGHTSIYAESEADVSYADTENMSALGDFRLGSVLGDDMSELGANMSELGGITEEVVGEYTPPKSNKAEFSALWKTRIENDTSQLPPAATVEVSPAKSIEDSVLGVSLSETNRVIRRMKEENATNSFLDVSHHAPKFDIDNASTDSEAEDESMLFHAHPAPPTHLTTTIPEVDEAETNSDAASSNSKGAPSSTTKSAAGSIIDSILGDDEKKPEDNLASLRYLDNSMTANGARRTTGDMIIDDDVSNAETSVGDSLLDDTADYILHGKNANLLSEVASSTGTDDEPRFFQLDMPAAYRMDGVEEADANDEQSVGVTSYDGSFYEM